MTDPRAETSSSAPPAIEAYARALPEELTASATEYALASRSEATLRAYAADWRAFTRWCAEHGQQALPAAGEVVALFLASEAQAGRKASTIARRSAAIAAHHRLAKLESPTSSEAVRTVTAGIRRTIGTRQAPKRALKTADLRAMVAALDEETVKGARDRALLLIGFASALRRSELVALDVEDIEECAEGLVLSVRRSKTDQTGSGRIVGVPFAADPAMCPGNALRTHLALSGVADGAVFRRVDKHGRVLGRLTAQSVALILKNAAEVEAQSRGLTRVEACGISSAYAAHSLRAGFATAAAANGASERAIMAQTGHQSLTVARRYIRNGSVWLENAATGLL